MRGDIVGVAAGDLVKATGADAGQAPDPPLPEGTRKNPKTGLTSAGPAEGWLEQVSAKAAVPVAEISSILGRYNIAPARALPPRRRLSLDGVHFAGMKDLAVGGNHDERELVPFSFTHEFGPGLTAFGTRNQNDAGKTSLLEVITWGLRGRCNLQGDVRQWIHQAAVEMTVADEHILVGWGIMDGRPRGRVFQLDGARVVDWSDIHEQASAYFRTQAEGSSRDGERPAAVTQTQSAGWIADQAPLVIALNSLRGADAVELAEFDGDAEFEAVMGELMLERLGLQRLPQWQKLPRNARVEDTDGVLSEHGWAAWSQALVITNPAIKIPLGEEQFVAIRLLQVYLGTAWAAPAAVAAACKSQLENHIGVLRRRVASVDAERAKSLDTLRAEVQDLSAKLAGITEPDAVAEADRLITEIAQAAEDYAQAQDNYITAAMAYGATTKLLESAEADEYALGQAAVTKRFWHSLKPSCCPRCDTAVAESRWQGETQGQCSLCGSDVDLAGEDGGATPQAALLTVQDAIDLLAGQGDGEKIDLDELDDLSAVRLQVAQLGARLAEEESTMDAARGDRDVSKARLEAALQAAQAVDPGIGRARRDVELALARAEGQLQERARSGADGPDAANLRESQNALTVVRAAESVARERRDTDQAQLLRDVSAQVTDLGRRLGVAQLESATLRGNVNMPVIKGGQRHNFGQLTEGEVLRLKIALVIALLRVGTSAGVGRHPGFLLIDSLGREELNPEDLVTMLQELQQVASEAQLQIVATSAYGDILERALPATSVRLSEVGEPMW